MSNTEIQRRSKRVKTLCAGCQERKARFRYRGEVRADRDHTLCFECHRADVNGARARRLGERPGIPQATLPIKAPGITRTQVLSVRQAAHRRTMLNFLQRPRDVASHAAAS